LLNTTLSKIDSDSILFSLISAEAGGRDSLIESELPDDSLAQKNFRTLGLTKALLCNGNKGRGWT